MSSSHPPQSLNLSHSNHSAYTLHSVHHPTDSSSDHTPLLPDQQSDTQSAYGTTFPHSPDATPNTRKLIFNATLKMAVIFVVSTAVLGATLWLALPTLDEEDRPMLKIPKSFEQLQALNMLLKKYRDIYPFRIVICYITTYLFLQAFSLPGSMYLSILGGAVWGVPFALPLACACVATGATLCYLLSAALGPALLALPKWKARLDAWSEKIQAQKDNIISFLIVLRIAPLPPHWVVNVICPHVGIKILPFWISTFFGIFGVTVIHTTIGGGLDQMTSAADFHLISWRNFFLLSAVVVGVLIPVFLRYFYRRQLSTVQDVEPGSLEEREDDDQVLAVGPPAASKVKTGQLVLLSDDEDSDGLLDDDDVDDDIILTAGPALSLKGKDQDNPSATRYRS